MSEHENLPSVHRHGPHTPSGPAHLRPFAELLFDVGHREIACPGIKITIRFGRRHVRSCVFVCL